MKRNKTNHPLYLTWSNMKQRCYNKNATRYKNYGARGIRVCSQWRNDFWQFVEDMGERPKGYTLNRIDNDKGYSPENCEWASRYDQDRNTTKNRYLTYKGVTRVFDDWCKQFNIPRSTLNKRLDNGWSIEKALETPRYKSKLYTYRGKQDTVSGLAKRYGRNVHTVFTRLRRGWSIDKALDIPSLKDIPMEDLYE